MPCVVALFSVLLDAQADPNATDRDPSDPETSFCRDGPGRTDAEPECLKTPLLEACRAGRLGLVRLLLEKKARGSTQGERPQGSDR